MIKSVRFLLLLIAFVSMQIVAWGQPQERLVQVQVTPDHTNWLYKPGEKVKFKVVVLKCNIPQDNLEVRYEISEVSVSAILSCRPFFILIFLRCIKMKHYGFSRKSIWKNLETFP